jgi:glycosyltransferase involved in cell wall biosynthesis
VLHVETGRNWVGGPAQVLYLMKGLAGRGHEVALATAAGSGLGSRAKEAGLQVHDLRFGGDWDPRVMAGVARCIRVFRPDLVHLHSRRGADTWGAFAARAAGRPVVLSRRVDFAIRPTAWNRWRFRALYDRVICISNAIERVVLAGGVPPAKVVTVHSAVDTAQFRPDAEAGPRVRRQFGFEPDAPLFAIVAQLIPRKGHDVLFRAVQRLLPRYPTLRVAVFGRGAEEARLRDLALNLGVAPSIHWAGFHERMDTVLPGVDAVVHPARLEGLGVALLQSLACGRPVIACPVGGIPEAVNDDDGWLVPVDDEAALADAMSCVIEDPALASQKGRAGRALMERSFSVDAMVEGNLRVYESLAMTRE